MYKISRPYDLAPLLASRLGFTLQFFFFEVKVHTYSGKVRKIQVTGSSSICWRACQKSGGQYCPPLDLIGLSSDQILLIYSKKQGRIVHRSGLNNENNKNLNKNLIKSKIKDFIFSVQMVKADIV